MQGVRLKKEACLLAGGISTTQGSGGGGDLSNGNAMSIWSISRSYTSIEETLKSAVVAMDVLIPGAVTNLGN